MGFGCLCYFGQCCAQLSIGLFKLPMAANWPDLKKTQLVCQTQNVLNAIGLSAIKCLERNW